MSSEFSNNLPPSAKPFYFTYLQGFDWYKAQLLSATGPIANGLPNQQQGQGQAQNQTQNTQNEPQSTAQKTGEPPHITSHINKAGRIKIDGEIIDVNPKDKSFSIRTELGTLALKLAITATLPPEGLRVELDIPRPKEGQQIAFRPLPREQQSSVIKQQIISAEGQQAPAAPAPVGQTVPPLRANPPLIDSEIIQTPKSATNTAPAAPTMPPLPLLQTGVVITVTPLPPRAFADIIALPLQTAAPQKQTTAQVTPQAVPPSTTVIPPSTAQQTPNPATINVAPQNAAPVGDTGISQPPPPPIPSTAVPQGATFTPPTESDTQPITMPSTPTDGKAPLAPQNVAPSATASAPQTQSTTPVTQPRTPDIAAIKIEEIIPPAPQNSAPLAENAKPVTNHVKADQPTPQLAEFIGRTADNKPVIAVQNTVGTTPPPDKNAALAPQPPRTLLALNINADTSKIMQGTKILFTPAPEAAATPQPALPQTAEAQARPIAPQTIAAATIPPYVFPLTGTSNTWPALDEMTQSLQQSSPSAAQNVLQQSPNISSPAIKMEPAILFFLVAARSGDIASWLGDKATEMLRTNGKADTISRILQDFTTLSHNAREAGSTSVTPEWRSMPIPLFAYNEAHKIMLHYKYGDESKNDGENNDKKSMRFLLDLDLNKMGDVQLDGFAQAKRLDLIVRTQKPLSPSMQQIMRRKYSGALEVTGFKGELSFHGTQDKFVKLEAVTETSGFSI